MDLVELIEQKREMLNRAITASKDRGIAYATAEREYNIAKTKKAFQWQNEGMKITFITDNIRGDAEIANLKWERDCCEVLYDSAKDYINGVKLELRLLENQLEREWKG
jgi:glutamine synthetase